MSAGKFETGRYQLNNGSIAAVRVQPETRGLTIAGSSNDYPLGAATLPGQYALNLGGKRRRPFSARSVTLQWVSTAPAGYDPTATVRVAIFRQDVYDGVIRNSSTGTYLGLAVRAVGLSPETI